jgi:hypothetical protein
MDRTDILQNLSTDFSKFIKENLSDLKKLDSSTQREIGKLIDNFKSGLDKLS